MSGPEDLTVKDYINIGKMLREAEDGNLIVGSFAAEMAGQSYPFSKAMCEIMFRSHSDEALGRRFVDWEGLR